MSIKELCGKGAVGFGFLAGLCLFAWAQNGSASTDLQYGITEFRCDSRRDVGEEDRVRVKIKNFGPTDPGTVLTVIGMQGDTVIPLTPPEGITVFDEPFGGEAEEDFSYHPVSPGNITWQATVGGDEVFCTTIVGGPETDQYSEYGITEFRCDSKRKVGEEDRVRVKIQNHGSTDPGAALTVIGMQDDTVIPLTPLDGVTVFDEPFGGEAEEDFSYHPVSPGNITWQATVGGDEVFCTTIVGGPEANQWSAYGIKEFRCDSERKIGEEDRVRVKIINYGSTDPGTALTVIGMQDDTVIPLTPLDGVTVFDEPFGGETEEDFSYYPVSSGEIVWHAAIEGDEATCTSLIAGYDHDDDGDSDHDDDDGDGGGGTENIVAAHDVSSSKYNKRCNECHADVHAGRSLDGFTPSAHVTMFSYAPGKPGDRKQCVWCHRTVDLTPGTQSAEKSRGNLRKRIDVVVCTLCHGPLGPARQFYQAGLDPTAPDGAALYDLTCAACHRDLADSQVKGSSASEIREKIDQDKGGMAPLGVLSTEEIQAIADALEE